MPALADTLRDSRDRAAGEVLHELIDALLAEGVLTVRALPAPADTASPAGSPGPSRGEASTEVGLDGERWVEAAVAGGQRLRLRSRGPVLLVDDVDDIDDIECVGQASVPVDAVDVVRALARPSWAALDLVADDLAAAPRAVADAREAAPRVLEALAAEGLTPAVGEQLAALGDRPFHPLGRHKRGWRSEDAARWGPHTAKPFGVAWWAAPRARLATGEAADIEPADVLDPADRERLDRAMVRSGVGGDHVAVPVHPWQARHLGPPRPDVGLAPLADELGSFRATASLRTLVPVGRPDLHLKLPMAVASLGAGRQLPLRYLRNGDRAQRLLVAVAGHRVLAGRLHVCDETAWWTTPGPTSPTPGDGDPPPTTANDDHPTGGGGAVPGADSWAGLGDGDLGCQLRRFPAAVGSDPDIALVPLGAFGVTVDGRAPVLDALAGSLPPGLRHAGPAPDGDGGTGAAGRARARAVDLLAGLTDELVSVAVVGLAHGVMPELHGQNVLVAVRLRPGDTGSTPVAGLVLRDHDAVRIHPPWLRAAGLPDPGYVVDGRTPNTLVTESPEALLAWFQMLAVHLGVVPVVRALAAATGLDEADGWRTIAAATDTCLDRLGDVPDLGPAADVARRHLLEGPTWPVKLVLEPLLERGATCATSMPSAIGTAANPLLACAR
jgi:siderophore synthetase component